MFPKGFEPAANPGELLQHEEAPADRQARGEGLPVIPFPCSVTEEGPTISVVGVEAVIFGHARFFQFVVPTQWPTEHEWPGLVAHRRLQILCDATGDFEKKHNMYVAWFTTSYASHNHECNFVAIQNWRMSCTKSC